MDRFLRGYVDEGGNIQLPGEVHLTPGQHVLVAISPASFSEIARLSEAALARDWNRPEEDEAWSHLQRLAGKISPPEALQRSDGEETATS